MKSGLVDKLWVVFFMLSLLVVTPTKDLRADEVNYLTGFEGVVLSCRVSGLVKYEKKLCAKVIDKIETMAAQTNIALKYIGVFKTKSATKALDEETSGHNFKKPLILRVLISGTKGRTAGTLIQALAGVPQKQGFLLLWDKRLLSSGRVRKTIQVVPDVIAKRVKELFEKMGDGQN